jgi:hypothetical protein
MSSSASRARRCCFCRPVTGTTSRETE